MPLVRIDISKTASRERVRDVGDAVYNAMIAVANVPNYDRFQVVTRHGPDEIIYPEEGYLGIDYTPDLIIIQVTWVGGRSTEVKKKFYSTSPTKFTPSRACASRTSGSAWSIPAARTGRSAMARCSTPRSDGGQRPAGRDVPASCSVYRILERLCIREWKS